MLWYKIEHGRAHAVLKVATMNVVEFWCGKVRSFDEVQPAQFNDKQCDECHDYIKKDKKC